MGSKKLAEDRLKALVGDFSGNSLQIPADAGRGVGSPSNPPSGGGVGESPEVVVEEPAHRGPGRPVGSGRSAEARRSCSCRMLEEQYLKLGRMAGLAGCTRQDLMDEAYRRLIASFERENGPLDDVKDTGRGVFKVKF